MNNNMKKFANMGRNGDTQLVHMRPDEVQGLGLLGQATGNPLTTNPNTGLPEAWSLPSWVLPVAAIAATVMTGGAAAPVAAGALGAGGAAGAGALGAGALTAAETAAAVEAASAGGGLLAGAPGLSAAAAAEAAGGAGGLLGTQAAAPVMDMGSSAGLLDKANYATGNAFSPGGLVEGVNKVAKPVGTAMNVANMFQQPPKQEMPIMPAPMPQVPQTGPQGLAQLAGQNQAMSFQQTQKDALDREKRKKQIAGIGGMY